MSANDLIAEITESFGESVYPGDSALVADDAAANPVTLKTWEAFRGLAWQQVPDDALREERTGLELLSDAGFAYYLPAFLVFLVRDFQSNHHGIDAVVDLLKLPTEINGVAVANLLGQYELASQQPKVDFTGILQSHLAQTNADIHRFVARASQFTPVQGRAVCHFLAFIRDERGAGFVNNEPELAIQRYWFQFA